MRATVCGLRDRLPEAERQRVVLVGAARQRLVHEDVPRHLAPSPPSTASSRMPCSRSRSTMRSRVRCEVMPMPRGCAAVMRSHSRTASSCATRVRSICSGVIETRPFATAWKSVPVAGVLRRAGRADPVHRLAARGRRLHHRLGLVALAEPRDLQPRSASYSTSGTLTLSSTGCGERPRAAKPLDQLDARPRPRSRSAAPPCGRQRDRDRRDAEQIALGRGRDRAGIDRVVAHVGAVVDAGDRRCRAAASSSPVTARCTQSVGVPLT